MLVSVQADQQKFNCLFSYKKSVQCDPIESALDTFTVKNQFCDNFKGKLSAIKTPQDVYFFEPGCLFRLHPSVCQNRIFRNFPSRIDENSARFLTNNENLFFTWQGS